MFCKAECDAGACGWLVIGLFETASSESKLHMESSGHAIRMERISTRDALRQASPADIKTFAEAVMV